MQGARFALPLLLLALISANSPAPARAQATGNQAGLVIVHGDGRVTTLCVAFPEPLISGADLISRSGLSLVLEAGPLGMTVCSLNGEGCPSTDCFCECHGTPCVYWNYYHSNPDGSWTYANTGAATRQITNGDVDAWLWGESSELPPSVTFDAICDQAAPVQAEPVTVSPPAQETPVPTASTEPAQTDPPTPTETPPGAEATVTATSSPTPAATATAVVKTSIPAATAAASPTPTSEAQASSDDGSAVNDVPTPAPEPTQSDELTQSDDLVQGRPGQIVAFVAVLSIVGGAFALLSRRSGAR
ncbi:MAG: hypothetical protein MUQ30_09560 [Anaerolineae bacterium]|nr:hypothetical protein [Anaerolineae bacterium]